MSVGARGWVRGFPERESLGVCRLKRRLKEQALSLPGDKVQCQGWRYECGPGPHLVSDKFHPPVPQRPHV